MAKGTPIEEVSRLSKLGLDESKIITKLAEEGYSPVQIHDALNQSDIQQKINVATPLPKPVELGLKPSMMPSIPAQPSPIQPEKPLPQIPPLTPSTPLPPAQPLQTLPPPPQPDISIPKPEMPVPKPSAAPPMPQGMEQPKMPAPQQPREENPYVYPTYDERMQSPKIETEVIEEIAEEIVNEKWQEVKTKISDVIEWKSYAERRLNSIDERIKRIESTMDRLQAALLSKVNEYSREIKDLGAGMDSLEGALGKVLSPLVENVRELSKITEELKQEKISIKKRIKKK